MRSATFQSDFGRVFNKSKVILKRKQFKIIEEDKAKGTIIAERKGSIFKPSFSMQANVIKYTETSTKVIVSVQSKKRLFRKPFGSIEMMEGKFIAMLSGSL
jgi:hypothetical protein